MAGTLCPALMSSSQKQHFWGFLAAQRWRSGAAPGFIFGQQTVVTSLYACAKFGSDPSKLSGQIGYGWPLSKELLLWRGVKRKLF